jgi:hypothetical protein
MAEQKVIWEEDYPNFQAEQKAAREKAEREKIEAEEALKNAYKKSQKIKSQLEYSDQLAQEICERISAGELLINICDDDHMPTVRRCNQWLKRNDDFNSIYKESINDRLNIFEEEVIKIADDMANDWKDLILRNGETKRVIDSEVIARAKLRVEVRFKHLKAGRPSKWGESTTLITKQDNEMDPTSLSMEELEKKIADIDNKTKIVRAIS